MKITQHANLRMKQRQISQSMVDLALTFGKEIKNTDKVVLSKNEVELLYTATQQLIKQLQKVA